MASMPAFAGSLNLDIKDTDVKVIKTGRNFVHVSWKVKVYNRERYSYDCLLRESLRDREDYELDHFSQIVILQYGRITFTGSGMVRKSIWNQVSRSLTHFDCR